MTEADALFMEAALDEARRAFALGEVPVGCVIVLDGEIISSAHNRRETDKNALAHAEILAIDAACKRLGGWRLHRCDLYVTLEPCPMCMGAIINARIRRVVFGALDPKAGCLGSISNFNDIAFNHHPEIASGVCEESSADLLKKFFQELRKKRGTNSCIFDESMVL